MLITAKGPLPKLISQHNRLHGPRSEVGILEAAPCYWLQSHDSEIVPGYTHSLHRLATVIANQEIEDPVIPRDSLEGCRLFLPLHPLFRRPTAGVVHFLPI